MPATTDLTRAFDRLVPHSVEAEMCTLSSLMLSGATPDLFAQTRGTLRPAAFFQRDHQILFEVICAVADAGRPVDAMIVREELTKRGQLQEVGGEAYLAEILNGVPNAAHGPHYAAVVREKAMLREILGACQRAEAEVYAATDSSDPGCEIAQRLTGRLARLMGGARAADAQPLADVVADVLAGLEAGETQAIRTGFAGLDDLTGGIFPGEMVVLGARPSMGKSTLGKQVALSVASQGVPVLIVSLEETRPKIGRNALSAAAGVDNHKLRKPRELTDADWQALHGAVPNLSIPVFVNDSARSLDEIRAAVAAGVARHGVRFVVIDYLQRIAVPGAKRFERVTDASIGISDMLRQLGVAGLVLAQLSREVAGRDDKRPTMSDLRESGQIEQDADGVLFLHREDYYHLNDPNYVPTGEAELIVAKWRDGARNKRILLRSDLRHQTFHEATSADPWDNPS
jgi:replicative DNA helicase